MVMPHMPNTKAIREERKLRAEKIQAEKLPDKEQVAKLDRMFGKGQGAERERAKIAKRLAC